MGRLPKINSSFGPIMAVMSTVFFQFELFHQIPLGEHHADIMSNHLYDPGRKFLDQSYSTLLKPKSETVLKRCFHWIITHPGVGFFLGFVNERENQWCVRWPVSR